VTRLRYGVSEVPITNGFSLESTDPNVLVQDFRVETTVRGGFGLSRLYFGIGAGYRRMGTITGRFSDQGGEGTNSLYFSLTPQGAVAGCTAGILLNHPTAVGAYALLAASVDASAMHAEYVQHFPGSPFGAADYVTTPRVQSWLGVRLEIGMDVAFPFLWQ